MKMVMEMKTGNELEMKIGNETQAGNELEMNSTVEFEAHYKEEEISGFLDMAYVDDEKPLQFYDETNQPNWQIPANPHRNPSSTYEYCLEADYEFLTNVLCTTDILQYLCDFANDAKTIVIGENNREDKVFLLINGGSDE